MDSHKLLNEKASSIKPYEFPKMEVFFVGVRRVICASETETEKVKTIYGVW